MFEETTTYKRQQRRRGIIAWATGAVVLALFGLSIALGGSSSEQSEPPNPFSYTMTSRQYEELQRGQPRGAVLDRLEKVGLPEDHVKTRYIRLFPPPAEDVTCSFWQISDRLEEVVRICFSDADEALVEKLERSAAEESFGVQA